MTFKLNLLQLYAFGFLSFYLFTLVNANAPDWTPAFPSYKRVYKTFTFQSAKEKGPLIIDDPYFWLEDSKDPDVKKIIDDQIDLTESYMKHCKEVDIINSAIKNAREYDVLGDVQVWGEQSNNKFYMFTYQLPNDPRKTWYTATIDEFQKAKKQGFSNPPGKPFFNESLLSSDASAYIQTAVVSPDGKLFCYLVDEGKGDNPMMYFRSLDSPLINPSKNPQPGGENHLPFVIPNGWNPVHWTQDSKGFFYYEQPKTPGGANKQGTFKIHHHFWGDKLEQDVLIFDAANLGKEAPDSYLMMNLSPIDDWLVVLAYHNTDYHMKAYATNLKAQPISSNMKWVGLNPTYDYQMLPITIQNDYLYFQTDHNKASNFKIAKVFIDKSKAKTVKSFTELTDQAKVIDVVAERKDALIAQQGAYAIGYGRAIIIYVENGQNTLYLYNLENGQMMERILPKETLTYANTQSEYLSFSLQMQFTSWNTPLKYFEFELDLNNEKLTTSVIKISQIKGTSIDDYQLQEFSAISKDGTKIPYFVTSKKGTPMDGSRPVWNHFYGEYGVTEALFYFPTFFAWLNTYGGFFVWTLARGGGDFGGFWHDQAKGHTKQKTFDDIIAVSEDLVKRKITSEGKMIIEGGSGGGMAAAVVINQARAGLIGAALLIRPVCDVLGFELRAAIGPAQISELGNVSNPVDFDFIRAWTPYNNVDPNKPYPTVLVATGSDDDTVPPYEGYKCLAQYQFYHPKNPNPLLLYSAASGHKAYARNTAAVYDESVHQICVSSHALGLKVQNKKMKNH